MAKAGRFYEIRKQLGDKPYELTDEIHIPPMSLAAREAWRKASAASVAENYLQAHAIADGKPRERVDHSETIERALIGDQYEACRALFADDARAWDMFVQELKAFNKIDGTASEAASSDADAEGNGSATPA
ncbi:hypothetical protein [Mycolicibacterium wolinskyi]|uniref:hypothetical protein n=1 Tax=Mycolicibacterium wolinskyi TaxID=59750 RepID=UPI0039178B45